MKYKTYFHYLFAKIHKDFKRWRIQGLIRWQPLPALEEGCTAIIGMCSRIPYILAANLHCLRDCRWQDLKGVVITVDAEKKSLPAGFEEDILARYSDLNIKFIYYTPQQAAFTEKAKDPYIFSWLSWCTCLNHVRTKTVLIQDYDALVLNGLEQRYRAFVESGAKIQGIMWYNSEGFTAEDKLATTFEAFADVEWIRSFEPVMGYNRVGIHKGRYVNFDTFLDMQANYTPEHQRTIVPMAIEDLSHPSQMITQYMRIRNAQGKPMVCSAVVMIPFFHFLSGKKEAFQVAIQALQHMKDNCVDLLGDGVQINLTHLRVDSVDFILKLILQVLVKLKITPFKELFDYGTLLYAACKTPSEKVWVGDFTAAQRQWIEAAKQA